MPEWGINSALIIFLIVTIGDKALSFLKTRGIDVQKMSRQINELYDWHNHDDPDQPGVKIWWNQKYITHIIHKLSENCINQTLLLEKLHSNGQASLEVNKELIKLLRKISEKQDTLIQKVNKNG